jgi:hypothetical protein
MDLADVDTVFALVPIRDTCSMCERPAVGGMPVRDPEEGTYAVWLCEYHAHVMTLAALVANTAVYQTVWVCGAANEVPCGAFGDYVAIVGSRDEDDRLSLAIVTVCDRHALGAREQFDL